MPKIKNVDVKVRMTQTLYAVKAMFKVHKSPFQNAKKKRLTTIELGKLNLVACS